MSRYSDLFQQDISSAQALSLLTLHPLCCCSGIDTQSLTFPCFRAVEETHHLSSPSAHLMSFAMPHNCWYFQGQWQKYINAFIIDFCVKCIMQMLISFCRTSGKVLHEINNTALALAVEFRELQVFNIQCENSFKNVFLKGMLVKFPCTNVNLCTPGPWCYQTLVSLYRACPCFIRHPPCTWHLSRPLRPWNSFSLNHLMTNLQLDDMFMFLLSAPMECFYVLLTLITAINSELTCTNICTAPGDSVSHSPQGLEAQQVLQPFHFTLVSSVPHSHGTRYTMFFPQETYPFSTIYRHIIGEVFFPHIHFGRALAYSLCSRLVALKIES